MPRSARVNVAKASAEATNMLPNVAKARRVKTNILASRTVPAEKQKIFESNAQESPFLHLLPPEIRNRIYRLVLTGNTIHVGGHETDPGLIDHQRFTKKLSLTRQLSRKICHRHEDDIDDAVAIQETEQENRTSKFTELRRPRRCCMNLDPKDFNLAILQTSRQVHDEAALLFYQENAFQFHNILDLEAFIEFLIPAQISAVQSISLEYDPFKSDAYFENRLRTKLVSLKSLVIFVSGRELYLGELKDVWESVCRFQRISIKSALVATDVFDLEWMKSAQAVLEEEWDE